MHNPRANVAPILPELDVAGVTGFAISEDSATAFLRCNASDGMGFILQVSAALMGPLIDCLQKIRGDLKPADAQEPRKVSVHEPLRWQAATAPDYPGVILMLDQDTATQAAFGFSPQTARELGKGLMVEAQKVASRQPVKLIMPGYPAVN